MIDAWPAMTPRRFFDILNAMNEAVRPEMEQRQRARKLSPATVTQFALGSGVAFQPDSLANAARKSLSFGGLLST